MRPTTAIVLVLVAACGGTRTAPAPEVAADTSSALTYQPAALRYAAVSHRQVDQEISGRTQTSRIVTRYELQAEIGPSTDGLPLTMVLDSIAIEGQLGVAPGEIAATAGSRFTARLRPTGELADFTGGDTTVALINQLTSRLRDFFPRIPADGVRPGRSWADTAASVTDVGGVLLTVRAFTDHEALDWTSYAGRPALAIRTVSEYTMTGAGEQSGQTLSLDGSGRRHAVEYLSAAGAYLGSVAADTSTFQVLLTQIGMTIPGQQWSADTIVVVD